MRIIKDDLIFDSTGRKEYIFGNMLTPNGAGNILYGSDGGISNLTQEEAMEVAKYMIAAWLAWLTETIDENAAAPR